MLFQSDWERVAREWGYPTIVLIVLGLIVKWALWPYLKRMLDRAERQADAVEKVLADQLSKAEGGRVQAETRAEKLARDFAGAIEENNRVSRKIAESLDELLRRTKT